MIPESNDTPPVIPALADDRPATSGSQLVVRLAGLLVGSFAVIALLGELVKLLVGADS